MTSYIYRFVSFVRRKGLMDLAALLLAAFFIWASGPYLGAGTWYPLSSIRARLIAIAVLVVGWGLWRLVSWLRRRGKEKRMTDALAGDGDGDDAARRADLEQQRLRERFQEATTLLRKRQRRDGRGLDTLPWYLLIGAPGAGKSTLLLNSGLDFPLGDHFGAQALAGVGGTRQCDWWFADQAVFLDSAGRYTTQDSDAAADAAAWQSFLGLLRRHRRRPLNGVVVAVSATDLLDPDDHVRRAHAHAVRKRLDELGERLRGTVPVYLVLTKCDLISGFTDFFADLDAAAREQVWGFTFPHDTDARDVSMTLLAEEFDLLLQRIDERVLDRLPAFRDPQRRAAALSFPHQLRLLRPALMEFVRAAFGSHGYADPPWLRGTYMTSGTQHGHPVDRVLAAVGRHFGVAGERLPAHIEKPRTYFVGRLLDDVMFAEAGLAGGPADAGRRRQILQLAAWVALTLSTLLLLSGMIGSYAHNRQRIAEVGTAVAEYPFGELQQADTPQAFYAGALRRFETLAHARSLAEPADGSVPWSHRFGLYRGRALTRDVQAAQLRDLSGTLLPALGQSLRVALERASDDPQWLYQLLKGYLMLGDPERRDVEALSSLAATHWGEVFPEDPQVRSALDGHLRVALSEGGRALSLDKDVVERARASLRTAELQALVYGNLVLAESAADTGAALALERHLGLQGEVFRRRSGVALSEPLPALYTRQGFQRVVGGGIDRAVDRFLAEDWVLGAAKLDTLGRSQLTRQVLTLYQRDYIETWERLLGDLELRPVSGVAEASAVAAKLGGPGSPLKAFLELLREHTQALTSAPQAAAPDGDDAEAPSPPSGARDRVDADPAGDVIERRFEPYHRLLLGEGGESSLDHILSTSMQMSRSLLNISAGVAGVDQNDTALLVANQQAGQLPEPMSSWMTSLAATSRSLVAENAGDSLRAGMRQAAGPECALFVSGRFPFDPAGSAEIPLRDFAELFGNGGRFDRFFQSTLAGKVDTGRPTWTWNDGMRALDADDVLQRAQRADRIRQAYFGSGGALPQAAFVLSIPEQPGVGRLQIEVDGQVIYYQGGVPVRQSMTWPGPQPGLVRIAVWDAFDQPLPVREYRGEWGLFRALHDAGLRRRGDLDYTAELAVGGTRARIDVVPASLRHPFASELVRGFRCP